MSMSMSTIMNTPTCEKTYAYGHERCANSG